MQMSGVFTCARNILFNKRKPLGMQSKINDTMQKSLFIKIRRI